MPKFVTAALVLALASSIALVTVAASEAPSTPAPTRAAVIHRDAAVRAAAPSPVNVVMRDPGCHWFAVGSHFKTKLAVPGTAKLTNMDEAALRIKGSGPAQHVDVGRSLALAKGAYTVTMVGQASDDNTLHLTVH